MDDCQVIFRMSYFQHIPAQVAEFFGVEEFSFTDVGQEYHRAKKPERLAPIEPDWPLFS